MPKYMTVVLEYEEGAKTPALLSKAFAENEAFGDTRITALSLEDEITRVEKLEESLG